MLSWNIIDLADLSHEYVEVSLQSGCDFRFWKLQLVSYYVGYDDCFKIFRAMGKMLYIARTWMLACAYKQGEQKETKRKGGKGYKKKQILKMCAKWFNLMAKLWQLCPSIWGIF